MRLLLDTNIFLWWIKNDKQLSKFARSKISNAEEVYVSSASIWEAVIKIKLKKLDVKIELLIDTISSSDFLELPITARHATTVAQLEGIHRDPFDRILIAQAICEPLTLLTTDKILKNYSDLVEVV
ncbi:MAG: type II toxin-antitoxin system VapC family toxin [Rhabdochlamydiaceae bacterium]|nr:type II toxin-antitoxin system VapC family toxin [Rhabdochlamydiaceae bacterium]